jgi:hypothetical protein
MGESLEWNRARSFLRNRYGGGKAIRKMSYPIRPGGTWVAEVERNGCIVRVEFWRTGHRRWAVLTEESLKGEGDDHTRPLSNRKSAR